MVIKYLNIIFVEQSIKCIIYFNLLIKIKTNILLYKKPNG
jgi:hypothetical protein